MPFRFSLYLLFLSPLFNAVFCQETSRSFGQSETDSIALERSKNYEARLKFIEKMRQRREKDPEGFADSMAQIREQRRFEEASLRIDDYKKSNLSDLKELDLSGARLNEMPDWIFDAQNLEVLVLDQNQITKLPKRLKELGSLKRIYWRYNDLADGKAVVPRLPGIEKIDLTGNSLSNLPKVHRLRGLKELVLEDNAFRKLPAWRGRRLRELKELNVSKNSIKLDKRWYGLIDHIEILKLNKCQISDIHPSFYKMTHLKELQIQINELKSIPDGISNLKDLEKLSFYKNQLSQLPKDFFDLKHLRIFDFYYNEFEKLPAEIGKLSKLEILYASFNKLYDIPSEIAQLSELEELYIHHNRLSEIPGNLEALNRLKILHFQNNYIVEFPAQILKLKNLKDLDISNTDIQSIPIGITDLKLKNFYWRNLDIELNRYQYNDSADALRQLINQGTNVVPKISIEEFSK